MNPPRPGSKLLVLDIDYTLFDHRSVATNAMQLMRPYLHEFLTKAYRNNYDIVIWSATSMKWIKLKMDELGVTGNLDYKLAFMVDSRAMISVHAEPYGVIEVKPLGYIWKNFKQVSKMCKNCTYCTITLVGTAKHNNVRRPPPKFRHESPIWPENPPFQKCSHCPSYR